MADITVPQVDFSILGNLGNTYSDARRQAVRERTLATLGTGAGPMDYMAASKALLAAGDTEGGLSLARLGETSSRDTRDFGFRQQESQRAQANADRGFGFQQSEANRSQSNADRGFGFQTNESQRTQGNVDRSFKLQEAQAKERPSYQQLEGPDGQKHLVRIDPYKGTASVVAPQGWNSEPTNPFAYGGKMNETQSKDALYTSRMLNAEKVFREDGVSAAAQSPVQVGLSKLPGAGTYYSPNSMEFQKYDQAKRDFVNATLRRESGAVISEQEFTNAERQYFPRPGDTKEVLKQKQTNRIEAIRGIGAGAGPAYRPSHSFDEQGGMIERPKPQARPADPQGWRFTAVDEGRQANGQDGSKWIVRGGQLVPMERTQ